MEKKIKVKAVSNYHGHDVKANSSVNLRLKCEYSELANSIQSLQMLNNDIKIGAKLPDENIMVLGTFRLKEVKVAGDGESVLWFNSQVDFVELENITKIVGDKKFQLFLQSSVEIEGEE